MFGLLGRGLTPNRPSQVLQQAWRLSSAHSRFRTQQFSSAWRTEFRDSERLCGNKVSQLKINVKSTARLLHTKQDPQKKPQRIKTVFNEWQDYRFPTALGFLCIILVYLRRKEPMPVVDIDWNAHTERRNADNMLTAFLMYCVPFRTLSQLWGNVHNLDIPVKVLRTKLFQLWTYLFDCQLDEMEKELHEYRNLAQFFTRNLKQHSRAINMDSNALTSPSDSMVYSMGSIPVHSDAIEKTVVENIKGKSYSLKDLIGDCSTLLEGSTQKGTSNTKQSRKKLNYIVLYLAPGDYHHFHSPHNVTFTLRRHFPGDLYPVRKDFVERVPSVYVKNERVALLGRWDQGFLGYVAVGAYNVGSIAIDFDEELRTNLSRQDEPLSRAKTYDDVKVCKGEHIGCFHLGSTIVLLFESSEDFQFTVKRFQKVKVGERLGSSMTSPPEEKTPFLAPPWPVRK